MTFATNSGKNIRSSASYQARSQFRGVEPDKAFSLELTGCIAFQKIALRVQQHRRQGKLSGEPSFAIAVMHGYLQTPATYKSPGALVKVTTSVIPAPGDISGETDTVITHRRGLPRTDPCIRESHGLILRLRHGRHFTNQFKKEKDIAQAAYAGQ